MLLKDRRCVHKAFPTSILLHHQPGLQIRDHRRSLYLHNNPAWSYNPFFEKQNKTGLWSPHCYSCCPKLSISFLIIIRLIVVLYRMLLPNSDIPATLSGLTCFNTDKLPRKILSILFDV